MRETTKTDAKAEVIVMPDCIKLACWLDLEDTLHIIEQVEHDIAGKGINTELRQAALNWRKDVR